MQIDFSLTDDSDIDGLGTLTEWSCPEHQVSGSVVKTLLANDQIGFKLGSFADAGATATISLQLCTITLVRLY